MIMAQAMVNFRMDEGMKADMERTCKAMGLSMTAAFTMFAKRVVMEQKIPFEVVADPFYSEENMAVLERRIEDLKNGQRISAHDLIEV